MAIYDVIGKNKLPQRTTKTCANCQQKAICTLSWVTGGSGVGENVLLVGRRPVWLCKWCRGKGLRDDSPVTTAASIGSPASMEAAISAKQHQVRDSTEQLFSAARRSGWSGED